MTVYLPPLYAAGVIGALLMILPIMRGCRAIGPAALAGLVYDGPAVSQIKTLTLGTWIASTVLFLRVGWNAMPNDGSVLWLCAYVGLFISNSVAARVIAAKWGAPATSSTSTTTETTVAKTETVVTPPPAPPVAPPPPPSPGGTP